MAKRMLLFDLDWTLIYTGGAGVRALNYAFLQQFNVVDALKNISLDGKTDPAICREMIRVVMKREPQEGEVQRLCRGYLDRLALEVPQGPGYKILPGIPSLLEALSGLADIAIGLGTGNLEEGAKIKLARADLLKYFRFGGFGSDAEERPLVLRKAVERGEAVIGHKMSPRDVYVIGDNSRDVLAGKAIGATTVAVASGPMNREELAATDPDFLFQDLSETQKVLRVLAI